MSEKTINYPEDDRFEQAMKDVLWIYAELWQRMADEDEVALAQRTVE